MSLSQNVTHQSLSLSHCHIGGVIIYVKKISRYLERKYNKRLKKRLLNYKVVENFLADLKDEFGGGDDETMKVTELKKIKQGNKMIEEFV